MKTQTKPFPFRALFLFTFLTAFASYNVQAQTIWGNLYDNGYNKHNAKGDYNQGNNRFIVTGNTQTVFGKEAAYLMETNMAGAITWQTFIGDTLYNFYGKSVKETSTGGYIVVGKTDKNQTYSGAHNDSCNNLTPYYNAFIAYINVNPMVTNWYHVFGDSLLHDEAIEVIEDRFGDFVVTGVASAKLSADTCYLNDSSLVSLKGFDQSAILFSKFDALGNVIFNKHFDLNLFDQGVSLIDDSTTNQYVVLVNRRHTNQNTYYRPLLLQTDYNGALMNAMEYDQFTTNDKPPYELVKFRDDYVIVGQFANAARINVNSYFLVTDWFLNAPVYSQLTHNYQDLLLRDVLVDNDTLVVSGDSRFGLPGTFTYQSMLKADLNFMRQPTLIPLSGMSNISHYYSYTRERNSNFCIYTYTDTLTQNTFTGYHLFGNSNFQIELDQHKTDHQTVSMCHLFDTIMLDTFYITQEPTPFNELDLEVYDTFYTLQSDLIPDSTCSVVIRPLGPKPLGIFNASETSENLMVYPNPVHDILTVQLSSNSDIINSYILASDGSIVRHLELNTKSGSESQIDLRQLDPGVYILVVQTALESMNKRFIKY